MPIPKDQLGIGTDVHNGNQPILMRNINSKHARRRIRAHVPTYNGHPIHPRLGMKW